MQRPYKSSAWSYQIGDLIYVGPDETYLGIGSSIEVSPVRCAKLDDAVLLKRCILTAISEFKADLPTSQADLTRRLPQPILKAANLKSFKALMAVAKCVGIVEWPDGRVEFTLTRNEGTRGGYATILPRETALGEGDYAAALIRAFSRCE